MNDPRTLPLEEVTRILDIDKAVPLMFKGWIMRHRGICYRWRTFHGHLGTFQEFVAERFDMQTKVWTEAHWRSVSILPVTAWTYASDVQVDFFNNRRL